MTAQQIISKKQDGYKLTEDELAFIISGYTDGEIPDYQISAFLMAIYFQGMDPVETATLTRLMRDSGEVLDLTDLPAAKVDKHSTGGVGDKVSLILAPLVAACGLVNPMISGRGLMHTGGTLDKLEAIPGFNTQIPLIQFQDLLKQHHFALIGQTPEICPADKKLYALRDATATVGSIPLICGSILSKKLAEGLDGLVLDVKAGRGGIFKSTEEARQLARQLLATAKEFGLKTVAVLSQMDQPLGGSIGSWFETKEAIDMLKGTAADDLYEITIELVGQMLVLGGVRNDIDSAKELAEEKLRSGEALQKFRDIVEAQGGDISFVDALERYQNPQYAVPILAEHAGYVHAADARELGEISMLLGAGRAKKEDDIDHLAGIILEKKVGDAVKAGERLCTLYADHKAISEQLIERALSAFTVRSEKKATPPVILQILQQD